MHQKKNLQKTIFLVTSYAQSVISFRGSLIRLLIKCNFIVKVFAPDHNEATTESLEALGATTGYFPLSRVGLSPISDLNALWSLWRIFVRSRPDIVLSYFAKPNIWGMLAAFFSQVPRRVAMVEGMGFAFTADLHNRKTLKQILIGNVIKLLYRAAFFAADRVIVLNPDDLSELKQDSGLSASKSVLLGGIGVELDKWKFLAPHLQPITFTMVARLLREKGVFEFLGAAQSVKTRHPNVRFILVGGLDSNPGAISNVDLDPWRKMGFVEFPGHVDVKPWLQQTSVFVLPSYREGVPLSTQEALAIGRPVITTDVPGCRETVVHGINGFLVPPRNAQRLAEAIELFIKDPSLIERMGCRSRLLAEERFDVNIANATILAALGV